MNLHTWCECYSSNWHCLWFYQPFCNISWFCAFKFMFLLSSDFKLNPSLQNPRFQIWKSARYLGPGFHTPGYIWYWIEWKKSVSKSIINLSLIIFVMLRDVKPYNLTLTIINYFFPVSDSTIKQYWQRCYSLNWNQLQLLLALALRSFSLRFLLSWMT